MATDCEVHRPCVLLDLSGFVGRRPDASVHSDGSRDTQQAVNTGRREPPAPTGLKLGVKVRYANHSLVSLVYLLSFKASKRTMRLNSCRTSVLRENICGLFINCVILKPYG